MSFYAVPEESCRCSTMRILKKFTQELVLSKKPEMKSKKLTEYVKKLLDVSTKQYDSKKLNDSLYLDKIEMKKIIRANFESDLKKKINSKDAKNKLEAVASTPTKSKQNVAEFFENFEPQTAIKKKSKINFECSSINSETEDSKLTSSKSHSDKTKSNEISDIYKSLNITPRHIDLEAIRKRVELKLKMEFKELDEQFETAKKRHFDELDIKNVSSFIKKYSSIKDDSGIIDRSFLVCSKLHDSGNVSGLTGNNSVNQTDICYCLNCTKEDSDLLSKNILKCTNFENQISKYLTEPKIDINELKRRTNLKIKLLREEDEESLKNISNDARKKDDSGICSFSQIDLPDTKILEDETFEFSLEKKFDESEQLINETTENDDSQIFSRIDHPETKILEITEECEIPIEQEEYEMEEELTDSEIIAKYGMNNEIRREEIYYPRRIRLETILEESFEDSSNNSFQPASQSQEDSASNKLSNVRNEEVKIKLFEECDQTSSILIENVNGETPRSHLDLNVIRKNVENQMFQNKNEQFEILKKRYYDEMDVKKAISFIKKYSFMKDDSGIINRKNLVCTKLEIDDNGYTNNKSENQSFTQADYCFCINCINENSEMKESANLDNQVCKYLRKLQIDINELMRRINLKQKLLLEENEEFRTKKQTEKDNILIHHKPSDISGSLKNNNSEISSFSRIDLQETRIPEDNTEDVRNLERLNLSSIVSEEDNYTDIDLEDTLEYDEMVEFELNEERCRQEEYDTQRSFLDTIQEESFESDYVCEEQDDYEEEFEESLQYKRIITLETIYEVSETSLDNSLESVNQTQEDVAVDESSNVNNVEVIINESSYVNNDEVIHLATEDTSQTSTHFQPESLIEWEKFSEVFNKFPGNTHLDLNATRKRVEMQLKLVFKEEDELSARIMKRYSDNMDIARANYFIKKYFSMKDESGIINRRDLVCTKFENEDFSHISKLPENPCFCIDCLKVNYVMDSANLENEISKYLTELKINIYELKRRIDYKQKKLHEEDQECKKRVPNKLENASFDSSNLTGLSYYDDSGISSFTQINSQKVESDEYFQRTNNLQQKYELAESETSFYDSLEAINETKENCSGIESSKVSDTKATKTVRNKQLELAILLKLHEIEREANEEIAERLLKDPKNWSYVNLKYNFQSARETLDFTKLTLNHTNNYFN